MLRDLLYNKGINSFLRNTLKPFSKSLPAKYKFPIHGTYTVSGNHVPPFKFTTNPTSYASKVLFWDNIEGFEFSSVKIFCEVVKSARVFFDIGANIGYYSLLASSIKQKDISVYAFEPMPSAYGFLEKNISINGFDNIKPQKLALSNQQGKATFYCIANEKFKHLPQLTGDGGLSQHQSGDRTKSSFEVDIDTLDSFVSRNLNGQTIDLIKLDTEANEHFVLMGAKGVLQHHRPIIQCEILKEQVEKEILMTLNGCNYLYFRATDKGLEQVNHFENNPTAFVDYYLVPEEKKELIKEFIC
jgi:FkbM family methyltransferase